MGCFKTGTSPSLVCTTNSTGRFTLTYTTASTKLTHGSDALTATIPGHAQPTATDIYSYIKNTGVY